ncbi:hypothetical protein C2E23DRAFT_818716 [Lenzites betulinus]|nr:hypothetical protein C2E23DRAFT_818716 [Lenzites betulinus]
MDQPIDNWVRPQGRFIGSVGLLFTDQTAADIYLANYWHTEGLNQRIAVVCTSWGMAMLYIQEGIRGGVWAPMNPLAAILDVQDHGILPPNHDHMLPLDVRFSQAGAPAVHNINGQFVSGRRLPWHRRVAVSHVTRQPLHYHQHQDRQPGHEAHVVPPIRPAEEGAHLTLRTVVYGSQVSNYRRAQR